jgi:hypothetical protein
MSSSGDSHLGAAADVGEHITLAHLDQSQFSVIAMSEKVCVFPMSEHVAYEEVMSLGLPL